MEVAATVPGSVTVDSRSLVPVLKNQADATERFAYSEIAADENPSNRMGATVRNTGYKLIRFTDGDEELYHLTTDPYETVNLLAGILNAEAQANYYSLVLELSELQDTVPAPEITATAAGQGSFSVTVKQVSGTSYGLWRSADMGSNSWAPLNNATSTTGGGFVTLTDAAPPAARAFYRVMATVP